MNNRKLGLGAIMMIALVSTTMVATPILLQQPDEFNVNRDKDAPIATFQL